MSSWNAASSALGIRDPSGTQRLRDPGGRRRSGANLRRDALVAATVDSLDHLELGPVEEPRPVVDGPRPLVRQEEELQRRPCRLRRARREENRSSCVEPAAPFLARPKLHGDTDLGASASELGLSSYYAQKHRFLPPDDHAFENAQLIETAENETRVLVKSAVCQPIRDDRSR
jgi:hypothetical protein